MSERVAVTLDGGLPQGQNWHQALLRQVAETGGAEPPPLRSGVLLLDLDEYRKFHHVVHHKYGDELKPGMCWLWLNWLRPFYPRYIKQLCSSVSG